MNKTALPSAAVRVPHVSLQRSQVRWLLIGGDLALVNLAALAALWLGIQRSTWWLAVAAWDSFALWFFFLSALWFVLAQVMDLYDLRVAGLPRRAVGATLAVVLGTLAIYFVIYFIADPQTLPRHIIVFFAVIAAVLLASWRGLFALALGAGPLARRVAIVGGGASAQALVQAIRENAANYYDVGAVIDPAAQKPGIFASLDEIPGFPNRALDELILATGDELDQELLSTLVAYREQGVPITHMATVYEELTGRVPVEHIGKTWTAHLPLEQDATQGLNGFLKRTLDVVLAGIALIVLAPFAPLLAFAVRLDSRGAVILKQTRIGKNGQVFTLYKFRTMIAEAELPGIAQWAEENDPRVTRVGRWLRRWKLDEAPQFFNVLRGEMSLVGPRPERPEWVEHLQREIPFYRLRHVVRPGLTGWAAVRFRYGRSVDDALVKLQYDLYYIKHQSLYLDLLILAKTLGAVLLPPASRS